MARKVSEGRAVKVTVPAGFGNVEANKFYLIQGFLGLALQSAQEGQQVVLMIDQVEYETGQINTGDAFNVGDLVYWDEAAKVFTTTATARPAGRVTQGKDANNTIWFVLGPQVNG